MEEEGEPIIIDLGSDTLKAGFASEEGPKCEIPMIVGKLKQELHTAYNKLNYYGSETFSPEIHP